MVEESKSQYALRLVQIQPLPLKKRGNTYENNDRRGNKRNGKTERR